LVNPPLNWSYHVLVHDQSDPLYYSHRMSGTSGTSGMENIGDKNMGPSTSTMSSSIPSPPVVSTKPLVSVGLFTNTERGGGESILSNFLLFNLS